jgi:hypothetical protein
MNSNSRLFALGVLFYAMAVTTGSNASDVMLYDFENDAELNNWQQAVSVDLPKDQPAPVITIVKDHATAGASSLKLTFKRGSMPGISTNAIPIADWAPPMATFHADVHASRNLVVVFRAIPEQSNLSKAENTTFTKIALLNKGPNSIEDELFANGYGGYCCLGSKTGKIIAFEILLYDAQDGDTLHVDNVRISDKPLKSATPFRQRAIKYLGENYQNYSTAVQLDRKIKVLGIEGEFENVVDFAKKHESRWVSPADHSINDVETTFKETFQEFLKNTPRAKLAFFRTGDTGFDSENPTDVYDGWRDCPLNFNPPNNLLFGSLRRQGSKDTLEFAARNRCPLLKCDISSIPKGARIHTATLALTRMAKPDKAALEGKYRDNSPFKPTYWVFEPCRRAWDENSMNAIQYAKGQYWREACGMDWSAGDPDFEPTIIAHGQSGLTICTWDFKHAVQSWISHERENHGFALYPVPGYLDFGRFFNREANVKEKRPLLMVIYEANK